MTAAVADAIRELGSVPSGQLYTTVMPLIDLRTYTRVIDTLKNAGLVAESADVLRWTGPALS